MAARAQSEVTMRRKLEIPELQKKKAAGQLTIDDILLSMGERGVAAREAAARASVNTTKKPPEGVLSALDEALLNMGIAPEEKSEANDGAGQVETTIAEEAAVQTAATAADTAEEAKEEVKIGARELADAFAPEPKEEMAEKPEEKKETAASSYIDSNYDILTAPTRRLPTEEIARLYAASEAEKLRRQQAADGVAKEQLEKQISSPEEQTRIFNIHPEETVAETAGEKVTETAAEATEETVAETAAEAVEETGAETVMETAEAVTEAAKEAGAGLFGETAGYMPGVEEADDLQSVATAKDLTEAGATESVEETAADTVAETAEEAVTESAAEAAEDVSADLFGDTAGYVPDVEETDNLQSDAAAEEVANADATEEADDTQSAAAAEEMPEAGTAENMPDVRSADSLDEDFGEGPVETPAALHVPSHLRNLFKGFLTIRGVDSQIAYAIEQALAKGADRTSRTGNILIYGGHGCGKTTIAVGLAKAIAKERGDQYVKMARIYATDLNRKDIAATIAKIAGGILIIEEAGDLQDAIADQLTTAMEFRTDGLIIIMEDEQKYIRDILMRHPRFTMKFTSQIHLPEYTNEDLVGFAQVYADGKDYTLSPEAEEALIRKIEKSAPQTESGTVSVTNLLEMTDAAIRRANKMGRKVFAGKKRFDEQGRVILLEKDFK